MGAGDERWGGVLSPRQPPAASHGRHDAACCCGLPTEPLPDPAAADSSSEGSSDGGAAREATLGSVLLAVTLGNLMEWYDFGVFGYMAHPIGRTFFPKGHPGLALLETYGVFGGAFLMRPVGGIVFGRLGDTVGRRRALELTLAAMIVPTLALACLPTYDQAGWAAPVLLCVVRLMQGFAVGGQLVGAFIFVAEHAPPHRQNFYGALVLSGANAGTTLGAGAGAAFRGFLSDDQLDRWGWRAACAAGVLFGLLGYAAQKRLSRGEHAVRAAAGTATLVSEVVRSQGRRVVLVAGVAALWTTGFWLCFTWLPTYMTDLVDAEVHGAFAVTFAGLVILVLLTPLIGMLADTHGSERLIAVGAACVAAAAIPAFWILAPGKDLWRAVVVQAVFALCMACVGCGLGAFYSAAFPRHLRFTALGLSYNVAQASFGAAGSAAATALAENCGPTCPGYYLAGVALLGLVCVLLAGAAQPAVLAAPKGSSDEDAEDPCPERRGSRVAGS
eukprot:TRINITY_DN55509_c0_g1_i1.p1 TRINITY_DN55509_c0_g1~~TRINITY_DN55509_c0_g1_i1.p1  ORF type:complete len:527 (+),score=127.39 TRINITY_DN55509_c0_g1_i1:81-1583(+)